MGRLNDAWLSTGQVARACGVSGKIVRKWADTGLLPYVRLPSSKVSARRFKREDVNTLAAAHDMPVDWTALD